MQIQSINRLQCYYSSSTKNNDPNKKAGVNFKANVKFVLDRNQPKNILSYNEIDIIKKLFDLIGFKDKTCFVTPFGETHRNMWTQRGINVHFFSHKGSKMHNIGAFYYSPAAEEVAIDKGALRAATKTKEELIKTFGPDTKVQKEKKYRRPLLPVRQMTEQEARARDKANIKK